jgi:hypothetical protein
MQHLQLRSHAAHVQVCNKSPEVVQVYLQCKCVVCGADGQLGSLSGNSDWPCSEGCDQATGDAQVSSNKCQGIGGIAIDSERTLNYVCHFSRPPILATQFRRRGDAQISRFLPKDGDKDKPAPELEQQVGVVTSCCLKMGV